MSLQTTRQVCIRHCPDFWWTVEDFHLDAGGEGITLSYWELQGVNREVRKAYLCLDLEAAAVMGDIIHQLVDHQQTPFHEEYP